MAEMRLRKRNLFGESPMREVRPHRRTHEGRIVTGPQLPERTEAHSRLMAALAEACESGERVPCIGNPDTWDGEHPELQEAAIHGCHVCDQLDACRRYVLAFPEPVGVWAGMTAKAQKRLHREANQ